MLTNQLPTEIKQYAEIQIKKIPAETLERFELPFMNYLSVLLNLKAENAENLQMCVPVILDINRTFTFKQIREMFELYADSRLSIQPISNYIDRILIGKIKSSYTDYLKKSNRSIVKPKKVDKNGKELSEEESYKRQYDIIQSSDWFESYLHLGYLKHDSVWVYDFLVYEKLIKISDDVKKSIYAEIKTDGITKDEAVVLSKLKILANYFENLKAKKLDLQSVLRF